MHEARFHKRSIFLALYLVFALLPIYWMVNMSFKTNAEILSSFSFSRSTSPGATTEPFLRIRHGTRGTSIH